MCSVKTHYRYTQGRSGETFEYYGNPMTYAVPLCNAVINGCFTLIRPGSRVLTDDWSEVDCKKCLAKRPKLAAEPEAVG